MAFNVHQQSHYNSLPSQKPHIARCSKCIQDMQSARAIPGHCELQETGCMIFSNVPPQQSRKKYSAKFQPGYILFGSFLLYFRRVPPLGFFHYFSFPSGMGRLVNLFFKREYPFLFSLDALLLALCMWCHHPKDVQNILQNQALPRRAAATLLAANK